MTLRAQSPRVPQRARQIASPIAYRVTIADSNTHLFQVELTIAEPAPVQKLQLPVWIPGSYLVREFARHLQEVRCSQNGKACALSQSDKATWEVRCAPDQPLSVTYQVYAFDNSVRTAWLDSERGFFNGTSLFLRAEGHEQQAHSLSIEAPAQHPDWSLATGLTPRKVNRRGFGQYTAENYDALVDCPVEMGAFWEGEFSVRGVPHRFIVAGAADSFDGERLLQDAQAICAEEMAFWHGKNERVKPPFERYVFMLNAVTDGYGGLEHRNSTALICPRKDLPRKAAGGAAGSLQSAKPSDGYTTLLGLISHEYFHTWNVKRLRPAEFSQFDYSRENYTELLWFFEGFTSYYDDLLLRRAARIDDATYLKLLGKTINQVLQTPGRKIQSVANASFDAWIKYYRPDENTANATVSYYTKGALVALCLDLTLRAEGEVTLDDVMRGLWRRCAGGPMTESDLRACLQDLSGRSFDKELNDWVHSTRELPLQKLLEAHGVQLNWDPDQLAQRLGLRVKEASGVVVQQVLRGGAAEQAGFAAGDEWLAVQATGARASGPWRLQTLDELTLFCGEAKKIHATIARDRRLQTLVLTLPQSSQTARLGIADAATVQKWLSH